VAVPHDPNLDVENQPPEARHSLLMSKRTSESSSNSSAPAKRKCTTRIYNFGQPSTATSTRYAELRINERGRRGQGRSSQLPTQSLVPDDLDPDKEINEWADDTEDPVEASVPQAGNASASVQKPKKRQTRVVCLRHLSRLQPPNREYRKN
jgi:hypothetical protein